MDVILFHSHIHSFMQSTQVNKYGFIPQCIKNWLQNYKISHKLWDDAHPFLRYSYEWLYVVFSILFQLQ